MRIASRARHYLAKVGRLVHDACALIGRDECAGDDVEGARLAQMLKIREERPIGEALELRALEFLDGLIVVDLAENVNALLKYDELFARLFVEHRLKQKQNHVCLRKVQPKDLI